jgi:hypothetical protein
MTNLDLDAIKNLFNEGLEYSKSIFPETILYTKNIDMCNVQQKLVNDAKDLTTLMNAISIPNIILANAYKAPEPICSTCQMQKNLVQFGVGNDGWYFTYGVCQNYCYVLSLGRIEIAPPAVVEKNNIKPENAVMWILSGGIGKIGGEWYSIPGEFFPMQYNKYGGSSFSLIGGGSTVRNVSFGNANNPFEFVISADFTDTKGTNHNVKATMMAVSPPLPNMKNSCGNCTNYFGTLYYSFTDMDIALEIDNTSTEYGKGWIDHQLVKNGIPKNIIKQSSMAVLNMILKPVSGGWLWFAIQDLESNTQYMFVHFFGSKFYKDDIKIGEKIPMNIINVYKDGVAYLNPTTTDMDSSLVDVILTRTIAVNNLNLPYEYNITLPSGKKVIFSLASSPDQFDSPYGSYENPAILYDENKRSIGVGIIEANGYFTNEEYSTRYVKYSGGDYTDVNLTKIIAKNLSPSLPQKNIQKFLSILIFLIPLWLIIFFSIFIFQKKENRKNRFLLSLAIFIVLYSMWQNAQQN